MIDKVSMKKISVALALAISLTACGAISGRETTGEYVDDATITAKVKTIIIRDLGINHISVESMQDVVQLSGFVDSQQVKTRAGEIARGVSGVKAVQNDLVVR